MKCYQLQALVGGELQIRKLFQSLATIFLKYLVRYSQEVSHYWREASHYLHEGSHYCMEDSHYCREDKSWSRCFSSNCIALLGVQSAVVDGRANKSLNGCNRFWFAHLSHNGVAVHEDPLKQAFHMGFDTH